MTGIVIHDIGLDVARAAVGRLVGDEGFREVLAELVVNQTKIRIDEEKASPDGEAWPEWSAEYAATRGSQHTLLIGEGDLQNSIVPFDRGGRLLVGSALVYAAAQHFGHDEHGLPAREYLGVSDANRDEIEELAQDYFSELLQ